jgi:two-component system, cell cycle response regulator
MPAGESPMPADPRLPRNSSDPDVELIAARRRIAQLKEEARKNEEAWRRSQQREMALLDADDLPALLNELTEGLKRSYRLQASSLSLADPQHEIRHLLSNQGTDPDALDDVLFVDQVADVVPQFTDTVRPWLGPYDTTLHRALFMRPARLASVALLPLLRHGRTVGSLHFASSDARRFTRDHASDFLHNLGVIAAFCLESAVNRARLRRSGLVDVLTGWHNRRYLDTRLAEEVARAQREQTPLACLMLDIDHFKQVNDQYGHLVGDEVLRAVAQRVSREVRGSDVSARFGGEEFVVLLPHTHLDAAKVLAERIRVTVADEPFSADGLEQTLEVTVSIGLSEYLASDPAEDVATAAEHLLREADRALYEAKAAGRNAVATAQHPRPPAGNALAPID